MNTYQSFFVLSIFLLLYISSGIGAYLAINTIFGELLKPLKYYMIAGLFMFVVFNLFFLIFGLIKLYKYLGTLT